jgi:NAD(P)-dependent dehydrogenase (short-subunit alcohol dehydrogenase family)
MALPPAARAVVTGAGSGLGRALCVEISRRGGRVVASDVNVEAARATAASLGGEAHAVACDVTKLEDVERLAAEVDRCSAASTSSSTTRASRSAATSARCRSRIGGGSST